MVLCRGLRDTHTNRNVLSASSLNSRLLTTKNNPVKNKECYKVETQNYKPRNKETTTMNWKRNNDQNKLSNTLPALQG